MMGRCFIHVTKDDRMFGSPEAPMDGEILRSSGSIPQGHAAQSPLGQLSFALAAAFGNDRLENDHWRSVDPTTKHMDTYGGFPKNRGTPVYGWLKCGKSHLNG